MNILRKYKVGENITRFHVQYSRMEWAEVTFLIYPVLTLVTIVPFSDVRNIEKAITSRCKTSMIENADGELAMLEMAVNELLINLQKKDLGL